MIQDWAPAEARSWDLLKVIGFDPIGDVLVGDIQSINQLELFHGLFLIPQLIMDAPQVIEQLLLLIIKNFFFMR